MSSEVKDTCIYCQAENCTQGNAPHHTLDDLWAYLAVEHEEDCEWVLTRAFQLDIDHDSDSSTKSADAAHRDATVEKYGWCSW